MTLRISVALLSFAFGCVHAASSLPALSADQNGTSVSGLSAGGFMAVQYQVAFSGEVVGSGIVAGGPYACISASASIPACMGQVPLTMFSQLSMLGTAQTYAGLNLIDPLNNLKSDRIYVFSGTKDNVVYQKAVDATVSFFKSLGVPASSLQYVDTMAAGHALVTPQGDNDCAINATPYINHCAVASKEYDQPGEMLKHIYGSVKPRAARRSSQVVAFNQREFAPPYSSMAEVAYVYIPQACEKGGCKVHVALHGCLQSAAEIDDKFYGKSSYNDWAESNRLIMLYPQMTGPDDNTKSCWDWIGYTGAYYATRLGTQINAIHEMVKRLTSAPPVKVASQ